MRLYKNVNSGVLIESDGQVLAIDFFFSAEPGTSSFPEPLKGEVTVSEHGVRLFGLPLAGLVFTHEHPDHYDERLLRELGLFGGAVPLITPENRFGDVPDGRRFSFGPFDIVQIPMRHDGKPFYGVPNTSLLVNVEGQTLLFTGDSEFRDPAEYGDALEENPPTIGFFMPYQLHRDDAWHLMEHFSMQRVFVNHLPFPQDDEYLYITMARQAIDRHSSSPVTPVVPEPLTWLEC